MTMHGVFCAALFFIALGGVARANLLLDGIVADVNRQLPEDEAISLWSLARPRLFEALTKYRTFYPDGKLVMKMYLWAAIGFACWFASAVCWVLSGPRSAGSS